MQIIKKLLVIVIALGVFFSSIAVSFAAEATGTPAKELKILAIGNSFSEDAMAYLSQIANEAGFKNVVLGNLYIGSCTLQLHWKNAGENAVAYTYQKITNGTRVDAANKTLLQGLQDEKWDIITLQQASGYSGIADSYNSDLTNLIDYVKKNKTNPNAKLGWHMTWAYEVGSGHGDFPKYNKDQNTMYQAIINATKAKIVPNKDFSFIIPAGTAVQNARTTYLGSGLTRDSYHLNIPTGRYIAAVTWLKALTGVSLDSLKPAPGNISGVTADYWPMIKSVVDTAIAKPFEVTPSTFKEAPKTAANTTNNGPIDTSKYVLLDWQPVTAAYWFSTNADNADKLMTIQTLPTANNFGMYVSSGKMFTKEDIPVGSIIEVDDGYQYRPEGWVELKTQATRPDSVKTARVTVDDAWWGNYNYRAFNISSTTGKDMSNAAKEAAEHFRIYIPKDKVKATAAASNSSSPTTSNSSTILIIVICVVIVCAAGLLIYLSRRKRLNKF